MGIYNVVYRKDDKILVNCSHRHGSLPAAIECLDAYLIGGLITQVETADRDQERHGVPVEPEVINRIREAMYGGTLHTRNRRSIGLVQEVRKSNAAPDR